VIARWQEKVRRGEMEFSQAREALFLETLRAFVSLADTLSDTFDRIHRQEGVFLSKPRSVSVLVGQKTEAQKTLDSWQPPEWEVTGMRTVKWDKEQTRHLMDRLASCE